MVTYHGLFGFISFIRVQYIILYWFQRSVMDLYFGPNISHFDVMLRLSPSTLDSYSYRFKMYLKAENALSYGVNYF